MLCPKCSAPIDNKAVECRNCAAEFGKESNWAPTDMPAGTLKERKGQQQADLHEVAPAPSILNDDRTFGSGCIPAAVGLFCLLFIVATTGLGIGSDSGGTARVSLMLLFFVGFAAICMGFAKRNLKSGIAAAKALAFSFYLPSILYSLLGQTSLAKLVMIFAGTLSVLINFWLVRVVDRQNREIRKNGKRI